MTTLNEALGTVMQLSPEEQEMVQQRREIARAAEKSLAEFDAGRLKPQSAEEVIGELRCYLASRVEQCRNDKMKSVILRRL
jgi:hypothetical protein